MGVALRSHDDDFDDPPVSDINVTPLVDVMLVLLIVFMVAAPLMAVGVPVDLPKTQAKVLNDQKPPIALTLDAAGKYFIGSNEIQPDQLLSTLLNQAESGAEQRIHVRANKDLPYRAVLEVMAQINAAGFTKVALVSDAPAAKPTVPAPGAAPAGAVPVGVTGDTSPTAAGPASASVSAPAATAAPASGPASAPVATAVPPPAVAQEVSAVGAPQAAPAVTQPQPQPSGGN